MKKLTISLTVLLLAIFIVGKSDAQTIGTFTDPRDGKIYKTVQIGDMIWLGENYAYKPGSGNFKSYEPNENSVEKYGYQYDWITAKQVVPNGWHLPSSEEFLILINRYGGEYSEETYSALLNGGISSFNVLFAGYFTNFWCVDEESETHAKEFYIDTVLEEVRMGTSEKSELSYIRLVKD